MDKAKLEKLILDAVREHDLAAREVAGLERKIEEGKVAEIQLPAARKRAEQLLDHVHRLHLTPID